MNSILALLALTGVIAAATMPQGAAKAAHEPKSLYDFTMKDIDGKDVKLSKFKGKVVLVVNTASKCGLTPQYEGLQKMYADLKDKGFVILGFPANEFGGQEPGTNADIKEFCTSKYSVTFPMFSKIVVKGEGIDPLYQWLLAKSDRPTEDIEWNFAKFVIDRHGNMVKRFDPRTTPSNESLQATVKAELAKK